MYSERKKKNQTKHIEGAHKTKKMPRLRTELLSLAGGKLWTGIVMPLLSMFFQASEWKEEPYLCGKHSWNETPGFRMCGKSWVKPWQLQGVQGTCARSLSWTTCTEREKHNLSPALVSFWQHLYGSRAFGTDFCSHQAQWDREHRLVVGWDRG